MFAIIHWDECSLLWSTLNLILFAKQSDEQWGNRNDLCIFRSSGFFRKWVAAPADETGMRAKMDRFSRLRSMSGTLLTHCAQTRPAKTANESGWSFCLLGQAGYRCFTNSADMLSLPTSSSAALSRHAWTTCSRKRRRHSIRHSHHTEQAQLCWSECPASLNLNQAQPRTKHCLHFLHRVARLI